MPALNYKKRFADLVEKGFKRSTIRGIRKRPIRIGDPLYHFTGMRTKNCRKLKDSVCRLEREILIKPNGTLCLDGQAMYRLSAEALALADGFSSLQDFVDFFCPAGEEFRGQYIQW